ncbi:MAG: M28 family peptidase [Armatimonadetes bacterium]|nr:M28 family peptidase [Armatimonadota bacterium]
MTLLGMPIADAGTWRRLRTATVAMLLVLVLLWAVMVWMPGRSYHGPLTALTAEQVALRDRLEADVRHLAGPLEDRNVMSPRVLDAAVRWLEARFAESGYGVSRQSYQDSGETCHNVVAELRGMLRPERVFVVGAHYDSDGGTPGADDNASGVAALLALARHFAGRPLPVTLRFVAFANEEPPHFWTPTMGSYVYAQSLRRARTPVVGMWSLESIGYFDARPGTQRYPGPSYANPLDLFYSDRGDFVAFVGNATSGRLVRRSVGSFRAQVPFPSEGMAATNSIPGIGWSDHWSFWKAGYPALMVTDTAPFRNPHYHQPTDRPETLDFDRFARVVSGLARVLPNVAR